MDSLVEEHVDSTANVEKELFLSEFFKIDFIKRR
jgi:hypothetical protein